MKHKFTELRGTKKENPLDTEEQVVYDVMVSISLAKDQSVRTTTTTYYRREEEEKGNRLRGILTTIPAPKRFSVSAVFGAMIQTWGSHVDFEQ